MLEVFPHTEACRGDFLFGARLFPDGRLGGKPERVGIRDQVAVLPTGSVVLAQDETHLDLIARIRACWMPRGLRHRVLTPGTNQRRTLHGAVGLVTGVWHHHVSVYNVSVVFCYFLEQLLTAYPDAPIVAARW